MGWRRALLATAGLVGLAVVFGAHVTAASGGSVLELPWNELLTPRGLIRLAVEFWELVGPGGRLHPAYFLEHKGHLVVEGLLVLVILYLFLQTTFNPPAKAEAEPLTDKEIDQLCREWQPEPLVPDIPAEEALPDPVVVTGAEGTHVTIDGRRVLNVAAPNFLGMANDPEVKATGRKTIDKYGVGSCGPRGFYGTIDVHLDLEEQLARFLGTEGAIIYAYDIATIASVIPAFMTRKDIIVMDERCSYPIQQGVIVSRSKVFTFKHNDMEDLEKLLGRLDAQERRNRRKPLCRKLIVVEGVYANSGDLAPIDALCRLKAKYRWRMIVEETHSFGVLGATGRGVCEHWGIDGSQIELRCASMSTALGSVGGFCAGESALVEHQRLSSSGYCFSASLPPYLATSASAVLARLADPAGGRALLERLRGAARALRRELAKVPGLRLHGSDADAMSPVIHLTLARPTGDARADHASLQRLADHMLAHSAVLVAVSKYSQLDASHAPPSVRVYANALLGDADVAQVAAAVRRAAKEAL